MRELSTWLTQHVVGPLNEFGIPIDLGGLQLVLVLSPVAVLMAAFLHAAHKKRRRLKDAGM